MTPARLYILQCPNCRQTLTKTAPPIADNPERCLSDRTWLRLVNSKPIETVDDRALAAICPVWNFGWRTDADPMRICDTCRMDVRKSQLIDLGAGGKYCSDKCADIGTEQHRAAVERVRANVEKLYEQMPWLRPQAKETA